MFINRLKEPWYPSHWGGGEADVVAGANELTFPNRWSAVSFTTDEPFSVAGCDSVKFDVSSTSNNPQLRLRLDDFADDDAGRLIVNDGDYLAGGRITSTPKTVTVPLSEFDLPGDEVRRIAFINASGREDVSLEIDSIRFFGEPEPEPEPELGPELPGQCSVVYDDELRNGWQPASTSVADLTYDEADAPRGDAQISVRFPRRWGALTHKSSRGVDVSGCRRLIFNIKASEWGSIFDVRITNGDRNPAATDRRITVGKNYKKISIGLSDLDLPDGRVTRIAIFNRNSVEDISVYVDDLAFVGTAPVEPPPPSFEDEELPPGADLPSGAECAGHVTSVPESVPENSGRNSTIGRSVAGTTYIASLTWATTEVLPLEARIDGNYTGTTDEIIQWAACKWGFPSDLVRAMMFSETSWYAGQLGDCGFGPGQAATGGFGGCDSVGALQVRSANIPATHPGTFPMAWRSTAFNLDYGLAVIRTCYEGYEIWLDEPGNKAPGTSYEAGNLAGCTGRWFSGQWLNDASQRYASRLAEHIENRPWENPIATGCPDWRTSFYCTGLDRNPDGSRP